MTNAEIKKHKYIVVTFPGYDPSVFIYDPKTDKYEAYNHEIGYCSARDGKFCREHFENMVKQGGKIIAI